MLPYFTNFRMTLGVSNMLIKLRRNANLSWYHLLIFQIRNMSIISVFLEVEERSHWQFPTYMTITVKLSSVQSLQREEAHSLVLQILLQQSLSSCIDFAERWSTQLSLKYESSLLSDHFDKRNTGGDIEASWPY